MVDDIAQNTAVENISIKLNNPKFKEKTPAKPYHLESSWKLLSREFPQLNQALSVDNPLSDLLKKVFPTGLQKHIFVRNLSFQANGTYTFRNMAIRPERSANDFIDKNFPEGVSLLFRGVVAGKSFIVNSIDIASDTEKLDFELAFTVIPNANSDNIVSTNIFTKTLASPSLVKNTQKRLFVDWKEYIRWKKELTNRRVHGCKYFKFTFDETKRQLHFFLVFEDKATFKKFKRNFHQGILEVFPNECSVNRWHFAPAPQVDDQSKPKSPLASIPLGDFEDVVDSGYIKDRNDGDYSDIVKEFNNPFFAEVAFNLSSNSILTVNDLLHKCPEEGFLTTSIVGELVLYHRMLSAISELEKGSGASPNIVEWLFDITKARLPKSHREIKNWLNPQIAKNENQKQAVQKMLDAPDICLIQGPPGTGKTTVIAEAIYQFALAGDTVLIASQSNDAVDNALSRLQDTPEVRPLRLGQARKKNKTPENDTQRFSKKNTFRYYCGALSRKISDNWIDKWAKLEKLHEQCEVAIRDVKNYSNSIEDLSNRHADLQQKTNDQWQKLQELSAEIANAAKKNESLAGSNKQFEFVNSHYYKGITQKYLLSKAMLRCFEDELNPLIADTEANDIFMFSSSDGDIDGKLNADLLGNNEESQLISNAIDNIWRLKDLKEKISNATSNKGNTAENISQEELKEQLSAIKAKIIEALNNDDEEEELKWDKKYKELKKQIGMPGKKASLVSLTSQESAFLKNEFVKILDNTSEENKEIIISLIDKTINDWSSAIERAFDSINSSLGNLVQTDINESQNQLSVAQGLYEAYIDELNKIAKQLTTTRQKITDIASKYDIKETSLDEIVTQINKISDECLKALDKQKKLRGDWEQIMRGFVARLNDNESFAYDNEHHKNDYIKACNVVGISCTDNMRELADNGFPSFDVVIIDEVSKATPPELLIPLMKARKAILVGDHRQLPPMFDEQEKSYKDLINENTKTDQDADDEDSNSSSEGFEDLLTMANFQRFQKMVLYPLFKEYFEQADASIKHSLLVQYRMHSDIMNIINRFYENLLSNGLARETENLQKNHGLEIKGVYGDEFITPSKHAYWIDSYSLPSNTPFYETFLHGSTSANNILEKYIIMELLKKIATYYNMNPHLKKDGKKKTVGVISFYQMQVNELRNAFRQAGHKFDFSSIDVVINTVDRFQGQEKNIIISSLVRNSLSGRASKHIATFERINVAFSRAQELLLIVGSSRMYEACEVELPAMNEIGTFKSYVYRDIISDLRQKACFMPSSKIISPEIEEQVLLDYEKVERR